MDNETQPLLGNSLLFFPAELFQQIVTLTNLYHEQNLGPGTTPEKRLPITEE